MYPSTDNWARHITLVTIVFVKINKISDLFQTKKKLSRQKSTVQGNLPTSNSFTSNNVTTRLSRIYFYVDKDVVLGVYTIFLDLTRLQYLFLT